MKKHLFTIVVEKDADGYMAYCPQLQGCYAQGDSYKEALANIEDAIRLHIEDRGESDESWNEPRSIQIASLELAI